MKAMHYLKVAGGPAVAVEKDFFTVGYGAGYDLAVPGTGSGILFSLQGRLLIPGDTKLRVNGKPVSDAIELSDCDRIEWADGSGVCLGEPPAREETDESLAILKALSRGASVDDALELMVASAGAESGAILCETPDSSAWTILASAGAEAPRRKALVSHTVLGEAIRTKQTIYVESLIGHRWEAQASLMEASVQSLACVPLTTGRDEVFGALFLSTKSPGRAIDRAALEGLRVVATHAALLASARRALSDAKAENRQLRAEPVMSGNIVFAAANPANPMHGVAERIAKLSGHDLSVLIRGETGTGKELVAREIHERGPRAKGPFVAINCAAIPPTLMESLLFGYAKGAFTGAVKDRAGKIVQAHRGTLFLDEIGDLSADLQTKLLRVLQEKEVEPVGGERTVSVDIRVLSATHQDLEALVREGKFRKDLYYRLNGATISIPPLRLRGGDDILLLADYFLARQAPDYVFAPDAVARLRTHKWPGNVRELEQVVSRAVALSPSSRIPAEALELVADFDESATASAATLREGKGKFTQEMLKRALSESGGNRSRAATLLGISERTLYRLLAAERG